MATAMPARPSDLNVMGLNVMGLNMMGVSSSF
jgi:hypothetical protein